MSEGVQLTVGELEATFGVLFSGYLVSLVLFGFSFFQTYVYYSRYSMDWWVIKAAVASIFLLDFINSSLLSHTVYHYLIILFPKIEGLVYATPTFCAAFGLNACAIYIVQMFYSYRIWCVGRHVYVTSVTAIINSVSFALAIATTVGLSENLAFATLATPHNKALLGLSAGLCVISGTVTFGTLCYILSPSYNSSTRQPEGWYATAVAYTFSRGSLATLNQLVFLVTFLTMPKSAVWMPFNVLSSTLFINSMLCMLINRDVHQGRGLYEEEESSRTESSSSAPSSGPRDSSNVRFGITDSKPAINFANTRLTDIDDEEEIRPWQRKQYTG